MSYKYFLKYNGKRLYEEAKEFPNPVCKGDIIMLLERRIYCFVVGSLLELWPITLAVTLVLITTGVVIFYS